MGGLVQYGNEDRSVRFAAPSIECSIKALLKTVQKEGDRVFDVFERRARRKGLVVRRTTAADVIAHGDGNFGYKTTQRRTVTMWKIRWHGYRRNRHG